MFNGHYDTVSLAGYAGDPLNGGRRGGGLFGRGASARQARGSV